MNDWFMERDMPKVPHVILNDKLMTDALLGTLPIKSEHSYSLNSDGDSMPDSPGSNLENKMEGKFTFFFYYLHYNKVTEIILHIIIYIYILYYTNNMQIFIYKIKFK